MVRYDWRQFSVLVRGKFDQTDAVTYGEVVEAGATPYLLRKNDGPRQETSQETKGMTIPTGRARTSKAVALFLALIGRHFR